jgi:hypothetical protein
MPFDFAKESVQQACPEPVEGLTANGINNLPFVLSLSKDLFSASLNGPRFLHYS